MYNRRQFLKGGALATLGSLTMSKNAAAFFAEKHAIGLQLYTLFNVIDTDVEGTLKKVAAIGFTELESAFSRIGGYYGKTPKEFAALTKSLGLSWKSHHVLGAPFKLPPGAKMPSGPDGKPIKFPVVKNLKENMQQLVDEAAEGGIKYLVCASIPITTGDEVKEAVEILTKTGEAAKKAGVTFCYHNHDREFVEKDGKRAYDTFLEIPADLMKFELDLAWVTKAKVDPLELFKKHPGRFPLVHCKDFSADFKTLEPVGQGVVDFKRIFSAAKTAGIEHYFVEHDMPKDPFASITTSYAALRKLGL
ncbi:MAG: sugar phosphate isomerase/epimerase [Mucilaginibacter polytrichastri]|nr:sugar phosphate isomerase/epimerase [Mucilaginibacter polytrichastri]